jgi:hypothetical protein
MSDTLIQFYKMRVGYFYGAQVDQIDFSSIRDVSRNLKGLGLTVFINWVVKPFSMAFFAWLFFSQLYSAWLSPARARAWAITSGVVWAWLTPHLAISHGVQPLARGDLPRLAAGLPDSVGVHRPAWAAALEPGEVRLLLRVLAMPVRHQPQHEAETLIGIDWCGHGARSSTCAHSSTDAICSD